MIMTNQRGHSSPPTSPSTSPPCHRDRLLRDLSKYTRSPHATQILPIYREFRLGHGDPLLAAAIDHGKLLASGKHVSTSVEKQIQFTDTGSLPGGIGLKDVVHTGKNEVIEFPCLADVAPQHSDDAGRERASRNPRGPRRVKQMSMPTMIDWRSQRNAVGDNDEHPVDHLMQTETTFAGLGMNDIVHVDKDTVISVPCVPSQMNQVSETKPESDCQGKRRHTLSHVATKEEGSRQDYVEDHGSPLAGLGMSDIIHILSGNDQVVVSLPVLPST